MMLMIKTEPSYGNEIHEANNNEFEDQFQASPPVNAEPLF